MTMDDHEDDAPDSANPRREDPRPSPIIEGTATEIPDEASEAGSTPANSASADSVSTEPSPLSREPAPRRSFVSALALALSVIALALAGWLVWREAIVAPAVSQREIDDLRSQVATLEQKTAAAAQTASAVASLKTAVQSADATARAAAADSSKALDAAHSSASAATAAQTAAERAAAAASGLASAPNAPASSPALTALDKRVSVLEKRADPQTIAGDLNAKITDLSTKLANIATAVASLQPMSSALASKMNALAGRLPPLEALLHAPKLDVAAINARVREALDQSRAAALIVVARSLQQAIDSGSPFQSETAAAQRLGADDAVLKPLQASAAAGVATVSELSQSFDRLAGPILAGLHKSGQGGFLNRLASEAGSLVQVRSVGDTGGDSTAAVIARIEAALVHGDVASALKARAELPADAQTLTRDWAARAQARVVAQQAAQSLLDGAVARVGKAPA